MENFLFLCSNILIKLRKVPDVEILPNLCSKRVICMFVYGFSSQSRIFQAYGDVTIAGEGLQILTFARDSCRLSSEGFLVCLTYCDTVAFVSYAHLRGPVTHDCRAFGCGAVFTTQVCRVLNLSTQLSACNANALIHCATAAVKRVIKCIH